VLVVKEIKETYARLPTGRFAVWKEEVTERLCVKLRSCARDLTGNALLGSTQDGEGISATTRVPLVIHKNQLVVRISVCPGLKFVVRQRGVDHNTVSSLGAKRGSPLGMIGLALAE